MFADDGSVPNDARLPFMVYRQKGPLLRLWQR